MKPNRYGISRPYETRLPLPIVVVVCDDKKTAVAYFTELKREVKAKVTLHVEKAACHGATAVEVVSTARRKAAELVENRAEEEMVCRDAVWALIDLESESDRQDKARCAKTGAEKHGVCVALSNPCFEVWTLAHLADTGEDFSDCEAVIKRMKAEWKRTFATEFQKKKAQADYSKLMEFRTQAIQRCKKRCQRDPSWTEVYKVVELIESLCNDGGL